MKTRDEIKEIMLKQLAERHDYSDVEEFIEFHAYSNDDEWRSGLDRFFEDVQHTEYYCKLKGYTKNGMYSNYSTDGGGDIQWIVKINGVTENHWLFRDDNSGNPEKYIDMILPYLYQMQVEEEVELTGIELHGLLNNTAVIYDGTMVYVGWLTEPNENGDVICVLENDGDRIEIVDGDKAILINGEITVKGISLKPITVGKFNLPSR